MCYESWNQRAPARKGETEQLDKAKQEADKVIEQARSESRKTEQPETRPLAETEKMPA